MLREASRPAHIGTPLWSLMSAIIGFNVGVEIGQVLALTAVLIALSFWEDAAWLPSTRLCDQHRVNGVGFVFTGYQIAGYYLAS